ncbi:MAG: hypothetical protein UV26_C0016G0004 [candidate division WWE3 bacterium GW2011_GWF2_42_42]|uniref:Uncharacterized protein n=1 Tax=candidate division WWE3 bacterium GW2011_GWF2_42_42 TaxID=1619142 RepID=A0A0G1AFN3_UNCKA|nr:MAG: hypothetical protein UV26_C0016G0004 [candidate division WWE3 bacterium GW2011_GWF2_42_42]
MKKLFFSFVVTIAGILAFSGFTFAATVDVYDALPSVTPDTSYPSQPFQAQQTSEFGDSIQLVGTNRILDSVTVTMVTWARFSEYSSDANYSGNTASWTHPITLNVYSTSLDVNGIPDVLLATTTENITVPWRPVSDPTCIDTGYGAGFAWRDAGGTCRNGLAFNATFDLSSLNVTLPNDVIVSVAYNTQTYGDTPLGVGGPYNSLNVAVPPGQPVSDGTDADTDAVFWNHTAAGFIEDTGWGQYGTVALKVEATSPVTSATIHIFKYVDGEQATTESVGGVSFPMFTSTYSAPFTLRPGGWTTGDIDYEASTSPITLPASYSAEEDLSTSLVGASCDGTHEYELVGYSTGDTFESALAAQKTTENPDFTGLEGDKYVIVWNDTCSPVQTLKVHVLKYLDGIVATAPLTNGYLFPMAATWTAANLDGGITTSGNYVLGNNHGGAPDLYGANTSIMNAPADYSTSEITDSTSNVLPVGAQCALGKFRLVGYKTSSLDFTDAWTSPLITSAVFTDITTDRYVIVANESCKAPQTADECKKDGWKLFNTPKFRNQGDCVSYVQSNPNATGNKKDNL